MGIEVRSVVSQAHQMAQITSREFSESPDGNWSSQAILDLNNIISILNEDQLFPFSRQIVQYSISALKNGFTIGKDEDDPLNIADIDYDRPAYINEILVRSSANNAPYRIRMLDLTDLRAYMASTDSSGCPTVFAVDNSYPFCTIYFDVKPSVGYQLELIYNKELGKVGINDTMSIPSSYSDLLVTALARRLAFNSNQELYARIDDEYNKCCNRIRLANSRTQIPLVGGLISSDYNRGWNNVNTGRSWL